MRIGLDALAVQDGGGGAGALALGLAGVERFPSVVTAPLAEDVTDGFPGWEAARQETPLDAAFAPTRWTLVLRARGESVEARGALCELCEAYYQPVFRFLRREGREEDAARELTQEFFARLLAGGGLGAADPRRGRFRSYLLGAVKHFLADQRDREHRQKRGRGVVPESLDAQSALQVADHASTPDDTLFDREWALAVMDRALQTLAVEFAGADKAEQFTVLKPWLVGDAALLPQAEAARASV